METRSTLSRLMFVLAIAGSAAAVTGCRAPKEPLYGQTTVVGDALLVSVTDAHVRGERVVVKTWLQNQTGRPVVIHRDALSLRLADGRVLPGPRGGRASRPLVIAPGKGRAVRMGFRTDGETDVHSARLLLSGVFVQGESSPRAVGEIALAGSRPAPPARKHAPAVTPERRAPDASDGAEDDGDGEDTVDWEGDEADAPEVEAPVDEAPSEDWQIGQKS